MENGKRVASFLPMLIMGGVLMLSGIVATQTSFAQGKEKTLVGEVSDTMCGTHHKMDDAAKCTLGCTSHGAGFALVVSGKVYKLTGTTDGIEKLAGAKAKVVGTVKGDTITVTSVTGA